MPAAHNPAVVSLPLRSPSPTDLTLFKRAGGKKIFHAQNTNAVSGKIFFMKKHANYPWIKHAGMAGRDGGNAGSWANEGNF
jgi:hypothetical protein